MARKTWIILGLVVALGAAVGGYLVLNGDSGMQPATPAAASSP